jgi:hypothetical protein
MKKVHLILQSKGGCGKSLLTWFLANLYASDETVLFMDVDDSTKTSSTRLDNILGSQDRCVFYPILNDKKQLERELFLGMFEGIAGLKVNQVFLDFGAPESDEFRKLLQYEISADSLVAELQRLNIELVLLVVVAGQDAFHSCMNFMQSLTELVEGKIAIKLLMNEGTFGGITQTMIGKQSLDALGYLNVYPFGNLGENQSGRDIINQMVATSITKPENMNLAMRLTLKKAMAQVEHLMADLGV